MKTFAELELLLLMQQEKLREVSRELKKAPSGSLWMQMNGKYPVFLKVDGTGPELVRKGISRKPALVSALAHKAYALELQRRLEINIRAIEEALDGCVSLDQQDILAVMPKSFGLLDETSVILGRDGRERSWPKPVPDGILPAAPQTYLNVPAEEWASRPYKENTKERDRKIHVCSNGVLCRSKSEMALLEIYNELAIMYHYDEVLRFGDRYFSPDLIGARSDGQLIYHEHLGLHDESYRGSYRERAAVYARFGIFQGKNLILTFDDERGRLNLKLAREIIKDAYRL